MPIVFSRASSPIDCRYHRIMVRMNDCEKDALDLLVSFYAEENERPCSASFMLRRCVWHEFCAVMEQRKNAGKLPADILEVK